MKIYNTLTRNKEEFKEIKEVSNKVLESFKEENLKYYDVKLYCTLNYMKYRRERYGKEKIRSRRYRRKSKNVLSRYRYDL